MIAGPARSVRPELGRTFILAQTAKEMRITTAYHKKNLLTSVKFAHMKTQNLPAHA